jgi:hypothetical protein
MSSTSLLHPRPASAVCLLALLLGLTGCLEAKVTTYTVAKSPAATPEPALAAAAPPAAPSPEAGSPASPAKALTWAAPESWKSKPATSTRLGSYAVGPAGEADFAITTFPGNVGGEFANLIRWRGQVGLPPVTEAEAAAEVTRLEHNGLRIAVVDYAGGGGQRMLGAIVPNGNATWFFKLLGPDAIVAAEKPTFLAFLQTLAAP